MRKGIYRYWLWVWILWMTPTTIWSQDLGNSPYSRIGFGDLFPEGFSHQLGTGGTGASFSYPFFINNINPALSSLNRITILDVGVIGQVRQVEDNQSSFQDFGATLGHLAISFPVARNWTSVIGISPYSSVRFENTFKLPVENSDFMTDVTFRSSGGLSKVYLTNAIELLGGKNNIRRDTLRNRLSLGLRINYFFGSTIDESISSLDRGNAVSTQNLNFYRRDQFNDFVFEPGISYTMRMKNDFKFHAGFVYLIGTDFDGERLTSVNRSFLDPIIDNSFDIDTVSESTKQNITFPSRLQLGLSLEKTDKRSGLAKWVLSADVATQDWSEFSNFDNVDTLGQSYMAALGFQWTPDLASVRKGFWRRSVYRAGFRFDRTALRFNNEAIDDISFSLGTSIPFGRSRTNLNLAAQFGSRGTLDKNLVREQYVKLSLGITIGDTWFIKPKYD